MSDDVVDAHHARRVPAQAAGHAVAPGHVGQRLGPRTSSARLPETSTDAGRGIELKLPASVSS